VVNAMIKGDIRPKASLGILPLGTANDFAKGAGMDAKDLMSALELACTLSPTKIDVGRMNDQYFINEASAGFGAEVTATTPLSGAISIPLKANFPCRRHCRDSCGRLARASSAVLVKRRTGAALGDAKVTADLLNVGTAMCGA